jgi:hypothetical protein
MKSLPRNNLECNTSDAGNGLVNANISARAQVPEHGGAVAVLRHSGLAVKRHQVGPPKVMPEHGKRGIISGFSRSSRRRMFGKLSRAKWDACPAVFVTLTYHDTWPDAEGQKQQLRAWKARLLRSPWGRLFGGACWRLEWQKRGAPHYHIVVFFTAMPSLTEFRAWCSKAWNAIVAPGDLAHLRAGTNCRLARNTSGGPLGKLMQYLGKYLAKQGKAVDPGTGEVLATGRIWGVWGRLPGSDEWTAYTMTGRAFVELTRRIRRWGQGAHYTGSITAQWQGFLILGDGRLLARLLRGLDIQET